MTRLRLFFIKNYLLLLLLGFPLPLVLFALYGSYAVQQEHLQSLEWETRARFHMAMSQEGRPGVIELAPGEPLMGVIGGIKLGRADNLWLKDGVIHLYQREESGKTLVFEMKSHELLESYDTYRNFFLIVLIASTLLILAIIFAYKRRIYDPICLLVRKNQELHQSQNLQTAMVLPEETPKGDLGEVVRSRNQLLLDIMEIEEQTENVFNSLQDALIVFGADGCIRKMNLPAAGLLEYGLVALKGKALKEILPEEPQEWVDLWWNNYDFLAKNPSFEAHLKNRHGNVIPVLCSAASLINSKAQFDGMILIARDLSQQKGQEARIQLLSKVVKQSPNAIVTADKEGVITYVNPTFLRRTYYSEHEVLGQHFSGVNLGLAQEEVFNEMKAAVDEGKVWSRELMSQKRDGEALYERVSVTAIRGEEGEVRHYAMILEDITQHVLYQEQLKRAKEELEERVELRVSELKEANRALERAYNELQSLDSLKDDFVSTVSHELRTPLASILGYAEALVDCEMPREEALPFYQTIISESERLTDLINDILDMSALTAEKAEFDFETLNMAKEVQAALRSVNGIIQEKKILVDYEPLEVHFMGDHAKMMQVLINLLGNAIKFSPVGSKVTILTRIEAGEMVTTILDEGPGVPEESLEVIFDRFKQHKSKNTEIKGTGLGLAICKKIIERHDGRIWAESHGKGGHFAFRLPLSGEEKA